MTKHYCILRVTTLNGIKIKDGKVGQFLIKF